MPGPHLSSTVKGEVNIHFMNADGSVKSTVKINDDTTNGPSLTAGDKYGSDIANMGDLDGDGVIDIAVGAEDDSSIESDDGAVYIHYLNANGSVKSTVKINENTANGPNVHYNGNYGNSVENIGDLDGDGVNDLAVGELNHDSHSGEGAVNIHFLNANGSIKSTVKIDPSTMAGDNTSSNRSYVFFGSSITNIGDHDRDGVTDIAVGSNEGYYNEDGTHRGEMSKGSVYHFDT